MLALYREGRQAEALDAFQRARESSPTSSGSTPRPSSQAARAYPATGSRRSSCAVSRSAATGCSRRSARDRSARCSGRSSRRSAATSPSRSFHPRIADDPAFVRRFEPEAQAVARAGAPAHRSRSTTTGGSPGRVRRRRATCAAGACGRSRTAAKRSRRTAPPRVVEQVASALALAHRQGVVHGASAPPTSCSTRKATPTSASSGSALVAPAGRRPRTSGPLASPRRGAARADDAPAAIAG